MKLISPYGNPEQPWQRGALHAHSTNSDGEADPHDVWAAYDDLGYDFVALTDHCVQPSEEDLETDTALIPIPGCEYRPKGYKDFSSPEVNVIGMKEELPYGLEWEETGAVFDQLGAFVIYNHPNWNFDHWPSKDMLRLRVGHAIEILNGVGDYLPGSELSTDKWDALLSCGYRIWGVAADDAHEAPQRGQAWVMVQAAKERASIVSALKSGAFYSSTGLAVESISVDDGVVRVSAPDAKHIRFVIDRGRVPYKVDGGTAEYTPKDDDVYVRVELYGDALQRAWTNPVWIDTEESRKRAEQHIQWYLSQPIT